MARAKVTAGRMRRHRAQRDSLTPIDRHVGRGSPHVAQQGGVMGMIDCQQREHTGPAVGVSRGVWHAAQDGASVTARSPSAATRSARAPA
jgi:hypothetical protein